MIATVGKWGNSLAVRIPPDLAEDIQVAEGMEIDLCVIEGNLVIQPRSRKRYTLDELVAGIAPENLHGEVDSGTAIGKEVW
jgi:antitoxin MazE